MTGAIVSVSKEERQGETCPSLQQINGESVWPELASLISAAAGQTAWNNWLKSLKPHGEAFIDEDGVAHLSVATAFLRSWVQQNYLELIRGAMLAAGIQITGVNIHARATLNRAAPVRTVEPNTRISPVKPANLQSSAPTLNAVPLSTDDSEAEAGTVVEYPDIQPIQEMLDTLPAEVAEIGQELAQREYDRNGVYPARWVLLNLLNTDPRLSDKGHDLLSTFVHRLPTAKDVLDRIAADTKQNPTEIRGPLRSRDLVAARHLAINIIRRLTKRSLPCIAKFMGGRDHTTALYSCSKIDTRRQEDPGFHAEVLRTEFEIDKAAWVRGRPVIRIHTSEEIQAKSAPGPVSKFAKNEDEDGADLIKRMLDARRQPLQLFLFEDDYDDEDPDELRHG